MAWTTPKDLKVQLIRLWERGELLRDAVTGQIRFPLRLTLKGPASTDITTQFEVIRTWVAELNNTRFLRVEWQEIRHRVQGLQQLPASVWIDSLTDALGWIGKHNEWQRFLAALEITRQQCPPLLAWLEKRPLQALELETDWPRLLAVVAWIAQHPRPGIYLRQVDLPGVHSKFIETHRAVLVELLDLALPADRVNSTQTGVTRFAARYGFLEKPARIRFRILDPGISAIAGVSCPDITLDAGSFSQLSLAAQRVFITENETNFLAFPSLGNETGAIVIFGAGYGWEALARAHWLTQCMLYYWGDIDTHGFAILDQLRGHFQHVQSILMDRATLEAHQAFWGREEKQQQNDLHRLTREELHLYNDLRDNRIREGLRLEQEYLGFGWVHERIDQLLP